MRTIALSEVGLAERSTQRRGGDLRHRFERIALLAVAHVAALVVVVVAFPETARLELEQTSGENTRACWR